jgi:hypothetical protein
VLVKGVCLQMEKAILQVQLEERFVHNKQNKFLYKIIIYYRMQKSLRSLSYIQHATQQSLLVVSRLMVQPLPRFHLFCCLIFRVSVLLSEV